jgi:phospholipid transport system substrate-binding protein
MNKPGLSAIILAAALALLTMITATSTRSLAADCPGASVVRNAGADFMNAARQRSFGAFSSALSRNADVRSASLFALGQYRKELPSARQREYLRNAQSFMAQVLLKNSKPFRSSMDLTIESCKGNLVETSLDGRSTMLWRLSGRRIKDVRVNGIWLTIQLRSKFTDVIRRNDGSVDALLDFLRRSGD